MKIVIMDAQTLGADMDLKQFEKLGEVVVYERCPQEEVIATLQEQNPDVILINKIVMGAKEMAAASNLKMIAESATGYNNIDIAYAKEHGIRVANVAGYSTQSVVQHTFAILFYLYEKLAYYDKYVKDGEYAKCPIFTHFDHLFHELAGKTWGIIGLGAIGRGVADVAKAFGCRVVYYSASGHSYDTEYEQVDFDTLLTQSDIISIHAPLNEYTKNLMNYDTFKKMKSSAYLVNVGRGPIVNDADLTKALKEDLIAGAAIDVLTAEPMEKDNPLLEIQDSEKLLITPHTAWATVEARTRLVDELYLNIEAFMQGKERNVIA